MRSFPHPPEASGRQVAAWQSHKILGEPRCWGRVRRLRDDCFNGSVGSGGDRSGAQKRSLQVPYSMLRDLGSREVPRLTIRAGPPAYTSSLHITRNPITEARRSRLMLALFASRSLKSKGDHSGNTIPCETPFILTGVLDRVNDRASCQFVRDGAPYCRRPQNLPVLYFLRPCSRVRYEPMRT